MLLTGNFVHSSNLDPPPISNPIIINIVPSSTVLIVSSHRSNAHRFYQKQSLETPWDYLKLYLHISTTWILFKLIVFYLCSCPVLTGEWMENAVCGRWRWIYVFNSHNKILFPISRCQVWARVTDLHFTRAREWRWRINSDATLPMLMPANNACFQC